MRRQGATRTEWIAADARERDVERVDAGDGESSAERQRESDGGTAVARRGAADAGRDGGER